MQLHTLKRNTANKKKKRIARGGKRGTYSGRGIKGQKARAGRKIRPMIRDIIKKIPKHRGYKFTSVRKKPEVVTLALLDKNFKDGEQVTPRELIEKKLIDKKYGRVPKVKILSQGDLTKKLTVSGCTVSKESEEKITQAGGVINKEIVK